MATAEDNKVRLSFLTLLHSLPSAPADETNNIWTNGDEILCPSEEKADAIADFLEALGLGICVTGYYDPKDDLKSGEMDDLTGWYYVDIS